MGATTTSVPRAHIHSEVFQESLIYSGCTNDIHPWTRILQWAHQRYTSLDSHPTLGALVIYIPRLAFYSGCSDNKHPSGSHSFRSFPRILNLQWAHWQYTYLNSGFSAKMTKMPLVSPRFDRRSNMVWTLTKQHFSQFHFKLKLLGYF